MFCSGENAIVKIVGAEHLSWAAENVNVPSRRYSALAFRIKGSAEIAVDDKKYRINENDVLYLPQNLAYSARYTDTEMLVIHFLTLRDDKAPEVYSADTHKMLYKKFLSAYTLWKNKNTAFTPYVLSELYGILGMLYQKKTESDMPKHFSAAISFINSAFKSSSLSVPEICRKSGMGETQLRVLFKKYYSISPTEYITELRLEYARALIAGGISVESAAAQSGFNDSKYFSRVVKTKLGCTPRELKLYGK